MPVLPDYHFVWYNVGVLGEDERTWRQQNPHCAVEAVQ